MSDDNTYNGWTNKPTWLVNLWIDNGEGSHGYFYTLAEELIEMHNKGDAMYEFAHSMEHWIEAVMPKLQGLPLDMMNYVVAMVNYREIAEHWINEAILQRENEE